MSLYTIALFDKQQNPLIKKDIEAENADEAANKVITELEKENPELLKQARYAEVFGDTSSCDGNCCHCHGHDHDEEDQKEETKEEVNE